MCFAVDAVDLTCESPEISPLPVPKSRRADAIDLSRDDLPSSNSDVIVIGAKLAPKNTRHPFSVSSELERFTAAARNVVNEPVFHIPASHKASALVAVPPATVEDSEPGNVSKASGPQCPICQDTCEAPASTSCGHVFCQECIRLALREKSVCPTCRKRITMKNVHRIFL
jgi:hypothetical protein